MPMNAKASPQNFEHAVSTDTFSPLTTLITTHITTQYSVDELQAEWCELQGRAEHSFFLSWTWTGTWLRSLPAADRPQLMRTRRGEQTVGLALMGRRQVRRHSIISSRGLHLNTTGDPHLDDITIEYNALLIDRSVHDGVQSAMLAHLIKEVPAWDECHMPGMTHVAADLTAVPGTRLRQRTSTTFQIDLHRLGSESQAAAGASVEGDDSACKQPRTDIEDYLELLGQKPRYHIRRSLRQYALLGALKLEAAQTLTQAQAFMAELQALHSAYWASKGRPGAFVNTYVVSFHQQLIAAAFERGEVQLLRLSAGDKVISCMYNFVYQGKIYHYQSGINYTLFDGQDSPGLVSHAMAVSLNAAAGHRLYDFMAGDQQYKRSLSTDTGELHWLVLQRDRLKFNVEDLLRRLKRRFVPRGLS
jgi:CelD/BcsL family acetyltransferase involved in cellulose biosynthesis